MSAYYRSKYSSSSSLSSSPRTYSSPSSSSYLSPSTSSASYSSKDYDLLPLFSHRGVPSKQMQSPPHLDDMIDTDEAMEDLVGTLFISLQCEKSNSRYGRKRKRINRHVSSVLCRSRYRFSSVYLELSDIPSKYQSEICTMFETDSTSEFSFRRQFMFVAYNFIAKSDEIQV
jgi:hypothetical protein